ncbi:MAG: trypsin-like serine protease, partial [Acidobacteriota bacterium]
MLAAGNAAHAIVVGGSNPNSANVLYGQPVDGVNLSGVVTVTSSIGGCTGTLLSDGRSILTAGHCVTSSYGSALASGITVTFLGPSGNVTTSVASVAVNPGWTGNSTLGGDLAVLLLSVPAPAFASGYDLYTGSVPFTSPVVVAGYGLGGTGLTGAVTSYGTLRAGENEYVVTGSAFGWSSTLLIAQFYESSQPSTNALNAAYPYSSADLVTIAHGDSGGPSFYNGQIIGVHDLGICFTSVTFPNLCATPPSVNSANNSYFGELFADTSVA